MSDAMKFQEIAWAEMKPDLYDGKTCDQVKPQWSYFCDGEEGEEGLTQLTLAATTFPPGTKVVISIPKCPDCNENCETCTCGFDWDGWRDNQYS